MSRYADPESSIAAMPVVATPRADYTLAQAICAVASGVQQERARPYYASDRQLAGL
jgi:hypothetical protein